MAQIVGALIALFAALVAFAVLTIASLNTLFALSIPYTVGTIASAFWLQVMLGAAVRGGVHAANNSK
jgi:hypothetical protein